MKTRSPRSRRFLLATGALWFVAAVLLAGCRRGEDANAPRIGVLVPTSATPIAQAMRRAMEQDAERRGIRLFWHDQDERPPDVTPAEQERRDLTELLTDQRIDALIYTPGPSSPASEIVRRVRAAGLPVICLDAIPTDLYVDAYVTTEYVSAGEEAALAAVEYLQSIRRLNIEQQINALVIEGSWKNESDRKVATGFYNVLNATPTVRIVGSTSAQNSSEAFRFVGRELNNYAGNVQLLLIANTEYVAGAILAAQTHGLAQWLVSASVGAGEEAVRLIIANAHNFEVDTMPAERAALALRVAEQLARGETPQPDGTYPNGEAQVAVFYGPRRVISKDNIGVMRALWSNLYPQ